MGGVELVPSAVGVVTIEHLGGSNQLPTPSRFAATPIATASRSGEAGIPGHWIGSIEIEEKRTLVEVPESAADKVIRALARTTIKGQRVTARRAD